MDHLQPQAATRVIKKIDPLTAGTRRWAATYGDKPVCVRYRLNPQRQRRLTTVEIVVDEAPTLNSVVWVCRSCGAKKSWRARCAPPAATGTRLPSCG